MKKNTAKKLTYVSRACMTVLTTVLIVLFFCIMSLVGKIQGTARVVNYAGLVRGTTQRIVKLENMQSPKPNILGRIQVHSLSGILSTCLRKFTKSAG